MHSARKHHFVAVALAFILAVPAIAATTKTRDDHGRADGIVARIIKQVRRLLPPAVAHDEMGTTKP